MALPAPVCIDLKCMSDIQIGPFDSEQYRPSKGYIFLGLAMSTA